MSVSECVHCTIFTNIETSLKNMNFIQAGGKMKSDWGKVGFELPRPSLLSDCSFSALVSGPGTFYQVLILLHCSFIRKWWIGLVVIHRGTKLWAEKTHLTRKNG